MERTTVVIFRIFLRSLFVLTAFSPITLLLSINSFVSDKEIYQSILLFCISVLLFSVCLLILKMLEKKGQKGSLTIDEYEHIDNHITAYIFLLMLPLMINESSIFGSQLVTTLLCVAFIVHIIAESNMYHYNPILSIVGYKIYSIKVNDHRAILIAKSKKQLYVQPLNVVYIANGVFMHTESMNNN